MRILSYNIYKYIYYITPKTTAKASNTKITKQHKHRNSDKNAAAIHQYTIKQQQSNRINSSRNSWNRIKRQRITEQQQQQEVTTTAAAAAVMLLLLTLTFLEQIRRC